MNKVCPSDLKLLLIFFLYCFLIDCVAEARKKIMGVDPYRPSSQKLPVCLLKTASVNGL